MYVKKIKNIVVSGLEGLVGYNASQPNAHSW
jgi:hypothetical protein